MNYDLVTPLHCKIFSQSLLPSNFLTISLPQNVMETFFNKKLEWRGEWGGIEKKERKKLNLNPEMLPPIPSRSLREEESEMCHCYQMVCASYQSIGLSLFKRVEANTGLLNPREIEGFELQHN